MPFLFLFLTYVTSTVPFTAQRMIRERDRREGMGGHRYKNRGRSQPKQGLVSPEQEPQCVCTRQTLTSPRQRPAGRPPSKPPTIFTRLLSVHSRKTSISDQVTPKPSTIETTQLTTQRPKRQEMAQSHFSASQQNPVNVSSKETVKPHLLPQLCWRPDLTKPES